MARLLWRVWVEPHQQHPLRTPLSAPAVSGDPVDSVKRDHPRDGTPTHREATVKAEGRNHIKHSYDLRAFMYMNQIGYFDPGSFALRTSVDGTVYRYETTLVSIIH